MDVYLSNTYIFFLKVYLFILERECVCEGMSGGRGRKRESQADSVLSTELTTGLDLRTLRS